MPMDPKTREKTTITTPFSRYWYNKMHFGFNNAPAIFQDLMQRVLVECKEFASVYIDDIVIHSDTEEEHVEHIKLVSEALRKASLTAKSSKCQWSSSILEYLGHIVGKGHYNVSQGRVEMFKEYANPKQLKSFFDMMGYYRPFIPKFANYSAKLSLSTSSKAPNKVVWTEEMNRCFVL